jgi:hypothetical protein
MRLLLTSDETFKLTSAQEVAGAVMLNVSKAPLLIDNSKTPPLGDARKLRKSESPTMRQDVYVSNESIDSEDAHRKS